MYQLQTSFHYLLQLSQIQCCQLYILLCLNAQTKHTISRYLIFHFKESTLVDDFVEAFLGATLDRYCEGKVSRPTQSKQYTEPHHQSPGHHHSHHKSMVSPLNWALIRISELCQVAILYQQHFRSGGVRMKKMYVLPRNQNYVANVN